MKRNKGICMDDVNSEFARQLDYELIEECFEEHLANLNDSIAHLQQAIGGSGTYGGSGPLVIHQVQ